MTERRRMIVHGRVQGVFFRDTTATRARELGLAGWVRNLPDGTVEIVAEGRPQALAALTAFALVGPPAAEVTGLDERGEPPAGLEGFRIV